MKEMKSFVNPEVDRLKQVVSECKKSMKAVYNFTFGNEHLPKEIREAIQTTLAPHVASWAESGDIDEFFRENNTPKRMADAIAAFSKVEEFEALFRYNDFQRMHMVMTGSLIADDISLQWRGSSRWVYDIAQGISSGKVSVLCHVEDGK